MRSPSFSLAIALAALLFSPTAALADTAFVLHATDTGPVSPVARAAAERGVRDALGEAGLDILGAEDDPESLAPELFRCENVRCVRGILGALGVDLVVVVALWAEEEGAPPVEITITLIDVSEREPNARADVEGDPEAAAASATSEALSSWSDEWTTLLVEGSPVGAAVSIDGRPVGTLPLRYALRAGPVVLSVSRAGYRTERLQTHAMADAAGVHRVEVGLEPEPEPEDGAGRARWVAGPVFLGALGAGAVATGAYGISQAGCQARSSTGECLLESELHVSRAAAWTAIGAAAIGASVAWVLVRRRHNARDVAVELSPFRLDLRTRF